jgi:hypothetical protein
VSTPSPSWVYDWQVATDGGQLAHSTFSPAIICVSILRSISTASVRGSHLASPPVGVFQLALMLISTVTALSCGIAVSLMAIDHVHRFAHVGILIVFVSSMRDIILVTASSGGATAPCTVPVHFIISLNSIEVISLLLLIGHHSVMSILCLRSVLIIFLDLLILLLSHLLLTHLLMLLLLLMNQKVMLMMLLRMLMSKSRLLLILVLLHEHSLLVLLLILMLILLRVSMYVLPVPLSVYIVYFRRFESRSIATTALIVPIHLISRHSRGKVTG